MDPLDDPQEFGRRVSAARGYMQEKKPGFAKAMGTSIPTVTRWEEGAEGSIGRSREERRQLAERIIRVTECPAEWFGIYPELSELEEDIKRRLEAARAEAQKEREAVAKQISDLRTQLDALLADVPQVDPPPELSPEEDAQERDRLERELADRAGSEPADSDSQSAAGS